MIDPVKNIKDANKESVVFPGVNSTAHRVAHFNIFSAFPVVAAFSDRHLDLGFDCRQAAENRKRFLDSLGIDYDNLVCAGQVHGASIVEATEEDRGSIIAKTDSLITKSKGVAIAVFTADCLPIFIYDKRCNAMGLAHVGWRGMKDKIIINTVKMMQERFASKVEDLVCAFGPALRNCCYEIGLDIGVYFLDSLVKRGKKLYLDLSSINKKQLFDLGIKCQQIEDSNICTYCSVDDFFSYRREKDEAGRMMSVMMLR